ncbi:MalY/PatB family protein [Prosthecomicrobium sp. N25]|uniref:MalY/PatB family protein n=1 Tax=Prosthecomicrobium sp. N25 TaxID=3129254 RepID=UPI0030777E0A
MTVYDFSTPLDRRAHDSDKWLRYPADVLPMWVADMDFACAPEIMDALRERLAHPVLGYTKPPPALKAAIAADMGARYGWAVEPDWVTFVPGVVPGLNLAMKMLAAERPGQGVTVQTPSYPPILAVPLRWGFERHDVELTATAAGPVLDRDRLTAALGRSAAFILCNPQNPTGKVYARDDLTAIAEACLARDVLVVADEIHSDLVFDGRRHVPFASLSPEIAARTITFMSAAKTYNVPGLHTAYAIIADKALRDRFETARDGLVGTGDLLGYTATHAAVTRAGPWRSALLRVLEASRDHLVAELRRRFPSIRVTAPEGTYLAWLDCSALGIPGEVQEAFLRHGRVAFSPGSSFGAGFETHARFNFGCPRPQIDDALDRMEAALAAMAR